MTFCPESLDTAQFLQLGCRATRAQTLSGRPQKICLARRHDGETTWYAVDDSDVENGCTRVIPGSHRQGMVAHGESSRTGNLLSINQVVESTVDDK